MPFTTSHNWKNEKATLERYTAEGRTYVSIAEEYGVTKQRIKQVFQKLKIEHIGLKLKAAQTAEAWNRKWGDKVDSDLYRSQRAKFNGKKYNAIRTGIEFTLTFGKVVWPKYCPMLGLELDYFCETRQENSVSFDRIDPSIGYVDGNVLVCSWRANRIKNDGTAEEHLAIAKWLQEKEGQKPSFIGEERALLQPS